MNDFNGGASSPGGYSGGGVSGGGYAGGAASGGLGSSAAGSSPVTGGIPSVGVPASLPASVPSGGPSSALTLPPGAASTAPSLSGSSRPGTLAPATAPALERIERSPAATVRQEPAYVPATPLPRAAFGAAGSQLQAALALPSATAAGSAPLSLIDLVQKTSSRSRRTEAVQEYWRTAIAALDLRFAEEEASAIQRSPAPDTDLKRSALAAARARATETRMEYRRQREELAARFGASLDAALPTPADRPFAGPYDTKILGIYGSRRPPTAGIELARLIAETAELVAARGEAAAYAADARTAAAGSTEQFVAACDRCRDARLAFLASLRDYNLAIANYALYVSDPSLPPETVAKMLVDVPVGPLDPLAGRTAIAPATPALVSLLDGDRPSSGSPPPIFDPKEFPPGTIVEPIATPAFVPSAEHVRPATAILPMEATASDAPRFEAAQLEPRSAPPRELLPADVDAPALQPTADGRELPDFRPTPDGLQPTEPDSLDADALRKTEEPAAPSGGLQFSGAAVR